MTATMTRCSKCKYSEAMVTKDPCNKCNEIQFKKKDFENYFLDSSKNLMRGELSGERR